MKKSNRFFAVIAMAVVSRGAMAMGECDRRGAAKEKLTCMKMYQRGALSDLRSKIWEIAGKPDVYGEAVSLQLQHTAAGEFARIDRVCRGRPECLYEEYRVWDAELSVIITKNRNTKKLEAIPEYNANSEHGS